MKTLIGGLAAAILLAGAAGASAQDSTTVIHKESMDGHSKTVVHHANGAKTVIHRHGSHVRKVHTSPTGEKTVVEKSVEH